MYFNFAELAREYKGSGEQIQVAPYTGRNQHVRRMAEYLQDSIADSLVGAYVHGTASEPAMKSLTAISTPW